jgi:aminoglycoside/choline kinase family phosphotransferase/dTDP-glucose pyrophosphorylase
MKALVLAAGFGTRLRPYSDHTPKPLFPIDGRPLLERLIRQLINGGCEAVMVNTHHLHARIEAFIESQRYPVPVRTRFEPRILGTGGAIQNLADFWDARPFLVVNSDILTDIDLAAVYRFHCGHPDPVTLALTDCPRFNTVAVSSRGTVTGFDGQAAADRRLTFTGIQVLDPEILDLIPRGVCSSSIDAYRRLLAGGGEIRAFVPDPCRWDDLGTPERYRRAARDHLAVRAFRSRWPEAPPPAADTIAFRQLAGDGSDRAWYRLGWGGRSLVLADHGIRPGLETCEADAFIAIGRHLQRKGVPVPAIGVHDAFSGLVFMEDLGDENLQQHARRCTSADELSALYRRTIDAALPLWTRGAAGFDPAWAYQGPRFDRQLILERECYYFLTAFVQGYLGLEVSPAEFQAEFGALADGLLAHGVDGLIHRDLQSRNIMWHRESPWFIDFQGARPGPVQYDLAALLIDPYVELPPPVQEELLAYARRRLGCDPERFQAGYAYCALSRNLQMLGAFGHLSRVKGKPFFESYIPAAVRTLQHHFDAPQAGDFNRLKDLARRLARQVDTARR